MKKSLLLLIVLGIIIIGVQIVGAGITDGSFETWTSTTNLTHWTESTSGSGSYSAEISRSTTGVRDGSYDVKINIVGGDYFEIGVTLLLSSLWVGLNIIVGVICLFPILVYTFHIPIALAALLQVLIYMEYIAGWIQFRTGRNLNG